jgi:peptidyl-prolyl cis-trans isomerase SurA
MIREILIALNFGLLLAGSAVIDRVAVIVGKRVVKSSDIDRNVRVSQFINSEPLNLNEVEKRKVADRLIDQEIIRQEMMNGGYSQPTDQDVNTFLQQLQRDRFKGSEAQLRSALTKYGLTLDQLRTYLLWQLTVLRFIDQRFRPGVLVTDEDVRAYYDQHREELRKAYPQNSSIEALDAKIREIIVGERVNQSFEEWLQQMRGRTRIEFRDAAFHEGQERGREQ